MQIFNKVQIAHEKFNGAQNVYSAPFKSGGNQPRMVCVDLYCFVFVCMNFVLTCICLYCVVLTCICLYGLISFNLMVAGLRLFHSAPPILSRKEITIHSIHRRLLVRARCIAVRFPRSDGPGQSNGVQVCHDRDPVGLLS